MIMGYVTLFLKLCELMLYIIVKCFQIIMFIFPWRKSLLDVKLKTGRLPPF